MQKEICIGIYELNKNIYNIPTNIGKIPQASRNANVLGEMGKLAC